MLSRDPQATIKRQVIKSGYPLFDRYLTSTVDKKNEKRRKSKDEHMPKIPQYSHVNLIKVNHAQLSNTPILAQQLLKTNFMGGEEDKEEREGIRYYEDFEAAQRLNLKLIKRFTQPFKRNLQQNNGERVSLSPLQVFNTQSKHFLEIQAEIQFNKLDNKFNPKTKLQTSKQILNRANQAILYLSSDIKAHLSHKKFQSQAQAFDSQFVTDFCQQLKDNLTADGISTHNMPEKKLQKFAFLVQSCLPFYVRPSEYQEYSPLPWKTKQLEKELAHTSFQKITGKVLYRFEHKIIELKENYFRARLHQIEKRGLNQIPKYIKENLIPKKQVRANQPVVNPNQSKEKLYFAQNLVSNHLELHKASIKTSLKPNHQVKGVNSNGVLVKNPAQRSNSYNSNSVHNFIKIRTKAPESSVLSHSKLQDELEKYNFSKHDQFNQNPTHLHPKDQPKHRQNPRNIIFNQKSSPPRKQSLDTRKSKSLLHIQIAPDPSYSDSQNESSCSEESKFFDTMSQYKQKKTTKKKKSFIKKTSNQPNSFGMIKMKQSRNFVLGKKGQLISFYPLKIGNLVLQRKNLAYIEYNSAKQELRNLPVKFLIDRIKHGINDVQIIVPSFGYSNPSAIKVNDQQKAKQIIKIISSLGGNVEKIKSCSGFDQKKSGHEGSNRSQIQTEIQIYKFFYSQMSYFEIVDALNLERQWLESQRDDRKLGGWKY